MAPSNGAAKSRAKQAVRPVVPLPYVKRQAAAAAAASSHPVAAHPPPPAAGAVPQDRPRPVSGLGLGSASAGTNGYGPSPAEPTSASWSADKSSGAAPAHGQATELSSPASACPAGTPQTLSVAANGAFVQHGPRHESVEAPWACPPQAVSSPAVSPPHYHMPPPMQAASRPPLMMANGDLPRGPRPYPQNGPHPMHHQAHPSNGSIHFGTFHDSQGSSPAPPHSGGIAPPPGMTGPDGRPPYMGPAGNGFPPMMPYGGDVMPVAGFDNYGRPPPGYGHMESFPPYGTSYGPSTPHSFHDSQSSAHPEDGGMFAPFPPGAPRNGAAVPGDDMHPQSAQQRIFGPPDYPRLLPGPGPPFPPPAACPGDGLIGHVQQQFASPEFADCTLELRYPDGRARPVRIPCHRLILCRSAELAALLHKTAPEASPPTIVLEADGRWMRSDAFYMAVQRLYGLPMLPLLPPSRGDSGDVVDAGSAKEQLDFCLCYAAAGRLLGWAPIAMRGCEVAAQLLGWQTMEAGLEFALDSFSDMGTYESHKYGDGSRLMLDAVAAYVVHNLPPGFSLDTTVEDPETYGRLPVRLPAPAPAPVPAAPFLKANPPAKARVVSPVRLGNGRPRPQQFVNIRFGDLSMSDSETPKASQQPQPASHAMLSRVLLNLPFAQVRMMLESPGPANANSWASREVRARIIKAAVDEREARRLRTLEAVVDRRVPVSDAVRAALRSPTPKDAGKWSLLGWQEEVLPEGPLLVRKWVPLVEAQNGSAAEAAAEYP